MPSSAMHFHYCSMLATLILAMCIIAAIALQGAMTDSSVDIEKASEQIEDGMTYDEVLSILGSDAQFQWTEGDETFYSWPSRSGQLTVCFEDGHVTHSEITRILRRNTDP